MHGYFSTKIHGGSSKLSCVKTHYDWELISRSLYTSCLGFENYPRCNTLHLPRQFHWKEHLSQLWVRWGLSAIEGSSEGNQPSPLRTDWCLRWPNSVQLVWSNQQQARSLGKGCHSNRAFLASSISPCSMVAFANSCQISSKTSSFRICWEDQLSCCQAL